jgi:hypothetical protein
VNAGNRRTDRNWLTRAGEWLSLYKIIGWAVALFLLSAGFGFETPKSKFEKIETRIAKGDTVLQIQIDTLKAHERISQVDRGDMREMIEFLVRIRCDELSSQEIRARGGVETCKAAQSPQEHRRTLGLPRR